MVSSFSFRDERDYPSITTNANELRTKLQARAPSYNGPILFVLRWTWLSFYQYWREWIKNEATSYKIEAPIVSSFSFRDECDHSYITINTNESRSKLHISRTKLQWFHPFRFEMNATILRSLLMRMNQERCYMK
jgi:hypothetical protein